MKKRGQFYLIAAIVIITIIIGFAAVSNVVKKSEYTKIYDLGDELGIEGSKVLEYDVIRDEANIENFIEKYADYAGNAKNLIFVFGDVGGVTVVTYEELVIGDISLNIGGSPASLTETAKGRKSDKHEAHDKKVKVTIDENEYDFTLAEGDNFYFVISQEVEGEQYVAQG